MEIYAEDAPYWGTAVPAEETLAEILSMLLSAGVEGFQPQRGKHGGPAWALFSHGEGRCGRSWQPRKRRSPPNGVN